MRVRPLTRFLACLMSFCLLANPSMAGAFSSNPRTPAPALLETAFALQGLTNNHATGKPAFAFRETIKGAYVARLALITAALVAFSAVVAPVVFSQGIKNTGGHPVLSPKEKREFEKQMSEQQPNMSPEELADLESQLAEQLDKLQSQTQQRHAKVRETVNQGGGAALFDQAISNIRTNWRHDGFTRGWRNEKEKAEVEKVLQALSQGDLENAKISDTAVQTISDLLAEDPSAYDRVAKVLLDQSESPAVRYRLLWILNVYDRDNPTPRAIPIMIQLAQEVRARGLTGTPNPGRDTEIYAGMRAGRLDVVRQDPNETGFIIEADIWGKENWQRRGDALRSVGLGATGFLKMDIFAITGLALLSFLVSWRRKILRPIHNLRSNPPSLLSLKKAV